MNKAAGNICVPVFVYVYVFSFLLGKHLGVEWLGHVLNLWLTL